jgi:hypothetical protein
MAKATPRQRKTTGRVMHEYAHGELKSGRSGKGGKVRSRKQAIAIALSESGSSRDKSKRQNRKAERKTEHKEARGRTAQQEQEGRSHVGARGKRESSRAMGGRNATRRTAAGQKAARTRSRDGGPTKADLMQRAKARGVAGRSKMSKRQLENALR